MPPDFPKWTRRLANAAPRGPGSTHSKATPPRNTGRCSGHAAGCFCAKARGSGAGCASVFLLRHRYPLQHQHDGPARGANVDGLVRRIQHQHGRVQGMAVAFAVRSEDNRRRRVAPCRTTHRIVPLPRHTLTLSAAAGSIPLPPGLPHPRRSAAGLRPLRRLSGFARPLPHISWMRPHGAERARIPRP